ncbi:pseudaminic acid synthase [Pseudomonadota bacterium]|jgi:pseudaminic acid synthase|nr:pseudaminic acid synthase [Pseudomonadota bacterium]
MINPKIEINNRVISESHSPYVIAELSANHNGSIETAMKIIEEAKLANADAVKLQTYTAETITLESSEPDFQIKGGLWDGSTLFDLYNEAHMPWEWHETLFNHAAKIGITIFSSPFDNTAVDFLEDLNAPAYKIASFEAIDLPLIEYVASTGKPMIISTGMANMEEIAEAIEAAQGAGCNELAILHCVSGYPAPAIDYNIKTITELKNQFGLVTGLSDHTLDNNTAIASVALGASIIEKHFTLNRLAGGPDDSFSLEPLELASLCEGAGIAWSSLGEVNFSRKSSEEANVQFRRSLYFVKDLKLGEIITKNAIRSVRPGYGMLPKYLKAVIGQKVTCDIVKNTPVKNQFLEKPIY